jgi:hypothetical protein
MMLSRRASVLLWLGIDGFGDSSTPYTCGWPYVTNLFWTRVINGDFPKRALAHVLEWKELHRIELLQAWALARTSRPLPRIDPLE